MVSIKNLIIICTYNNCLYICVKIIVMKMNRPKCGCGNTQNPDGYCDGSHAK